MQSDAALFFKTIEEKLVGAGAAYFADTLYAAQKMLLFHQRNWTRVQMQTETVWKHAICSSTNKTQIRFFSSPPKQVYLQTMECSFGNPCRFYVITCSAFMDNTHTTNIFCEVALLGQVTEECFGSNRGLCIKTANKVVQNLKD